MTTTFDPMFEFDPALKRMDGEEMYEHIVRIVDVACNGLRECDKQVLAEDIENALEETLLRGFD